MDRPEVGPAFQAKYLCDFKDTRANGEKLEKDQIYWVNRIVGHPGVFWVEKIKNICSSANFKVLSNANTVKDLLDVPSRLHAAAELFAQRAATYGDNYKHLGKLFQALFPRGLHCTTEAEFSRLAMFTMLVTKLSRYAQNMERSAGHKDSLDDLSVYAQMLAELDALYGEKKYVD